MKVDLNVDIHHLARVEGHGNIVVRVEGGELKEARWDVVETPRFFEAMLKDQHFSTAPLLAARICGICSISHALTSLRATEAALGVIIPSTAARLRALAKHGETLQSHYLHLFFLAAPDFVGLPSVLPLLEARPEVVDLARRLKGLANRLCDAVAGRTTHPVSLQVGGVARMPDRQVLLGLRDELARGHDDLLSAVELYRSFELPNFWRETEFVSLKGEGGPDGEAAYPFIGGRLLSTDGVERDEQDYEEMTNEYVVEHNTSKWCRLSRETFAVGPLARFNNNHRGLLPDAAELASSLGLTPMCHNPFYSHLARLVECVQATGESLRLLDALTATAPGPLKVSVNPKPGRGVGAVEAPRGILYHCYEYDAEGRIRAADCVIPTTQNNANIQHDLAHLVERQAHAGMTDEKLSLLCAMLVRSYDPCISCSVH